MVTKRLSKYTAVFQGALLSNLAYVWDIVFRSLFLIVVIFVFVQLWQLTYKVTGANEVAGFTLPQIIWYLVITETIVLSKPRLAGMIDSEVKSGDLAYRLNKPYNYVIYHYFSNLGETSIRFLVNLIIGAGVALVTVGPIPLRVAMIPAFLLVAVLGLSLDFALTAAIGLLAFWVEDTAGFDLIYKRMTMILGGMLIPLEVFPDWLRGVAESLPLHHIVYQPARLFVHYDPGSLGYLVGQQVAWLAAAWALLALIYSLGVKRVNVNGG